MSNMSCYSYGLKGYYYIVSPRLDDIAIYECLHKYEHEMLLTIDDKSEGRTV